MQVCFIVDVVLLDFGTDFDVASHHLLSDKFKLFGICSTLIDWIVDIIIVRALRVSVSSIRSTLYFLEGPGPLEGPQGPSFSL